MDKKDELRMGCMNVKECEVMFSSMARQYISFGKLPHEIVADFKKTSPVYAEELRKIWVATLQELVEFLTEEDQQAQ